MEVLDRSAALERLGGDSDRLEELLEDFQMQIPAVMKAIETAAKRKRATRIGKVSKELRATAYEIGADGMEMLAGQSTTTRKAGGLMKAPRRGLHRAEGG